MAQPLMPKLLQSALSVRNSCALQLLAITWQSHVSLQVVKNARYTYSEKAGVGGSTPSLATIFSMSYILFFSNCLRREGAVSWVGAAILVG